MRACKVSLMLRMKEKFGVKQVCPHTETKHCNTEQYWELWGLQHCSLKVKPKLAREDKKPVLRIRIRDPVPFRPRDPGWVKNQDPDPGSGSGMNIFWVKIIKFFYADADADPGIFLTLDPGSAMEKIRIRNPQHCKKLKSRASGEQNKT